MLQENLKKAGKVPTRRKVKMHNTINANILWLKH